MLTNQEIQHIRIDVTLVGNTKNVRNLYSSLQNQKYGNGMLHVQQYIKLASVGNDIGLDDDYFYQ
jgi:hypothetical protein